MNEKSMLQPFRAQLQKMTLLYFHTYGMNGPLPAAPALQFKQETSADRHNVCKKQKRTHWKEKWTQESAEPQAQCPRSKSLLFLEFLFLTCKRKKIPTVPRTQGCQVQQEKEGNKYLLSKPLQSSR